MGRDGDAQVSRRDKVDEAAKVKAAVRPMKHTRVPSILKSAFPSGSEH